MHHEKGDTLGTALKVSLSTQLYRKYEEVEKTDPVALSSYCPLEAETRSTCKLYVSKSLLPYPGLSRYLCNYISASSEDSSFVR